MAVYGSKTPVSALQEYAVSKKLIPNYEVQSVDGQGTHNPQFTIRVQIGSNYEDGTGRSKQEAKHRAAEKMLRSLGIIDSKTVEEEEGEFNPLENYVGQLKDLCYSQHYPEPKYDLAEEGGPAHDKSFKMTCYVSNLEESGINKTKKQAKQQAAYKMIELLKKVGGKKIEEALANPEPPFWYQNKSSLALMTDSEVINKYNIIKGTPITPETKDYAAFYKDHYKAYSGLKENSPTLKNLLSDSKIITLENSMDLLQEIAKELKGTINTDGPGV